MAASICRGFCELTAESRKAKGLPWIRCSKIGKSARSFCASSLGLVLTAISAILALKGRPTAKSPFHNGALRHSERGADVTSLRHFDEGVALEALQRGEPLRIRVR